MATWADYKGHIMETNPEIGRDLDMAEAIFRIVGTMIKRRHDLKLSKCDLADLCGLPHSSATRIELGRNTPNLARMAAEEWRGGEIHPDQGSEAQGPLAALSDLRPFDCPVRIAR